MEIKEQRELDAWLSENVIPECPYDRPTVDPASSDALDDKILAEHAGYRITFDGKNYTMTDTILKISEKNPDKKICRALFAQKLFSK